MCILYYILVLYACTVIEISLAIQSSYVCWPRRGSSIEGGLDVSGRVKPARGDGDVGGGEDSTHAAEGGGLEDLRVGIQERVDEEAQRGALRDERHGRHERVARGRV